LTNIYIYIHTYYTHIVWVDSIRQLCLPQVFLVGPSLFSVIVWMLETALMNWDVSANCNEMVLHPNKTNITASVWDLRKHQPDTLWIFRLVIVACKTHIMCRFATDIAVAQRSEYIQWPAKLAIKQLVVLFFGFLRLIILSQMLDYFSSLIDGW